MAIAGIGCQLQKLYPTGSVPSGAEGQRTGNVGIWADVAEVMSIDGPSPERDTYDTTTINTKGNYRTFIPGLKDGGEISMEMNYTPDAYREFKTDFDKENENALNWYSVVFNDNASDDLKNCVVFNGMVTTLTSSVPTDEKVSSNVTIKISGDPEFVTVQTRDNGTLPSTRIISLPSGVSSLAWRGFVEQLIETASTTSFVLPSAFGGTGAITYAVPTTVTGISFVASTRTLTIGSSATTGDHAIVYTATDSAGTPNVIKQGIVVTAL